MRVPARHLADPVRLLGRLRGSGNLKGYLAQNVAFAGKHLGPIRPISLTHRGKGWSEWQDLNLRPPRAERGALPGCATLRLMERPQPPRTRGLWYAVPGQSPQLLRRLSKYVLAASSHLFEIPKADVSRNDFERHFFVFDLGQRDFQSEPFNRSPRGLAGFVGEHPAELARTEAGEFG
jgi:hypothetical protein